MEANHYQPPADGSFAPETTSLARVRPRWFRLIPAGLSWTFALIFLAEFLGAVGGTIQAGTHYGWLRSLISVQTLIALPLAPGSLLLWLSGFAFVKKRWREGSICGPTGFCLGLVSNILLWHSLAPYRN